MTLINTKSTNNITLILKQEIIITGPSCYLNASKIYSYCLIYSPFLAYKLNGTQILMRNNMYQTTLHPQIQFETLDL